MRVLQGTGVSAGVAIGTAAVLQTAEPSAALSPVEDVQAELSRMHAARETAKEQLASLYQQALEEVGEQDAAIFEVHQMMLDDLDYVEGIEALIQDQHANAEYAVHETGAQFSQMFASLGDDYMSARATDVLDISARVVRILAGVSEGGLPGTGPVVVLADDLTPSQTVQLDKSRVLAFVTRHGSANSHTAILARTLGIPAIVGVGFAPEDEGCTVAVDATAGTLTVNPTPEALAAFTQQLEAQQHRKQQLQLLRGLDNVTSAGQRIDVFANIGNVSDAQLACENDAGGIGLFRSEFLFLESSSYPTEEQQFQAYKQVAETMAGKKVIIRTLDVGADKQIPYFNLEAEENPALGFRAIRVCLDRPEMFKTQLRAILRAAAFGTVALMVPMVVSVEEVRAVKALLEEAKTQLAAEGTAFGEVELGVMVETPAAAVTSDLLAPEVDFFSIGTNDLTQYTLAADRQNPRLAAVADTHHPAVLRLIRQTVENGHAHGCWVGICGELAADTSLAQTFLDYGVDELSVSPTRVLDVRAAIRAL